MEDNRFIYIDEIYNQQVKFKEECKETSVYNRVQLLKKLKATILHKEGEIKDAIYKDFRKSIIETETTEILTSILEINHFIKNLKKWTKSKSVGSSLMFASTSAKLLYEPKGNTLIITPWNYPFQLPLVHLIASVAAGNTVILKLSEFTPHINAVIKSIIIQVFVSNHVAIVEGEIEETTHLLALKFDHIHFTGSPAVGKIIMQAASKNLTDITLELGGKSPVFVDKNINIKEVVRNLLWAKFVNMGQTCIAPDYLLVDKAIEQEFDHAWKEEILNAFGINPIESNDLARIINTKQFDRLENYLNELKNSDTNWIVSGTNNKSDLFIHPTVLKNVPINCALMEDEIFGPILPIIYYQDIQQALQIVRSKEKPLALYIFSKKQDYINYVLGNTTAGGTTVNDAMLHIMHPNLPFGGVNNSGLGQSLGHYGFKSFSHERAVLKSNFFPMSKFFWYPYNNNTKKMLGYIKRIFT
ncbi:aldehyde dehydrogenase family protein [Sphingobacterium bovistauri]|uniref:Aldehyde dehydrogenase n=1 Tax=Sphingobacterium bovistauri TaxID=2781959 RepID=A0ABS7Z1V9_9SPHI|nr:aldehyde dehydrogenase family protein [Sphingobacterium bovistauri]MCA5004153.1 aldehyde dehydrogenase family protein [Sphingobacterium bovistauri]